MRYKITGVIDDRYDDGVESMALASCEGQNTPETDLVGLKFDQNQCKVVGGRLEVQSGAVLEQLDDKSNLAYWTKFCAKGEGTIFRFFPEEFVCTWK